MLLKFIEEKIKVSSFHFKLSKKAKKLSAFKIQYTQNIQTPLFKASDETEDDMQTVTLTKKQRIVKKFVKRIDKITKEIQFFDQNDNLILGLPYYSPQDKDQFGLHKFLLQVAPSVGQHPKAKN